MSFILTIDQSTSATKAILFNKKGELCGRTSIPHKQIYPREGWVEHDPEEIFSNTVSAISKVVSESGIDRKEIESIAITNQRETVVVWNKHTGKPICNAVVWQCSRGAEICNNLIDKGYEKLVLDKTGLVINPYFSASGVKWILDNVEGARIAAENGDLLMGTIDSWLIWKLTQGKVHATDHTNASRTLLFNINTLNWDDELFDIFTIPHNMRAEVKPCDSIFAESDAEGFFTKKIAIAGVMGDSHGALAGQMCFDAGMGKATYGTGSSVMVNIGEKYIAPSGGLVTSVGFSACAKTFYAFEGNIHCTGATIKWLCDELGLIDNPGEVENLATSILDNGGVYFVPAFAGLGAPWWNAEARASISGMTLGTGKAHIVRAALEAIAYQVKDLADLMISESGTGLKELRVDGGPTRNKFLMQFQADMLGSKINVSEIEEASALGATLMNLLARKVFKNLNDITKLRKQDNYFERKANIENVEKFYKGWKKAVKSVMKN